MRKQELHIEALWIIANAKYNNLYHDFLLLQYADRTWPLIILGIIMFLPGAYHIRIAYYAYRQYPGYSFDDIPEFDWSCGWRNMKRSKVTMQTFRAISRHIPWNTVGWRWFQTLVKHILPAVLTDMLLERVMCNFFNYRTWLTQSVSVIQTIWLL